MSPPTQRIDAHCHIFNVLDIPTFAFVMDVAIENPLLRALGAPFVAFFVGVAKFRAPSYDDELRVLTAHASTPLARIDVPRNSDSPEEQFEAGLISYVDLYTRYAALPQQRVERGDTQPFDDFIERHLYETFLPGIIPFKKESDIEIGNAMKKTAKSLATAMLKYLGLDDTARYIRQYLVEWAPMLSDYRFQIADLMFKFDGASAGPVLLTPAMLDLKYWLPSASQTPDPTSTKQQAELMGLISLAQPSGRVLHAFVAYDPMRQIADEFAGTSDTALSVVKDAISNKGCIGVKIYPPMGFRATGNSALGDNEFPRELSVKYPGLGARLDKALDQLYDYCASEDLPIMAHCAQTQGTSPEAASRAHPSFWEDVLKKAKYSALRVNLGHLGGVWALDHPRGSWGEVVAAMMKSGLYPNLYADVGDFSEVLGRNRDEIKKRLAVFDALKAIDQTNPNLRSHLLYGSDWHLLDREPGNAGFADAMATWIAYSFTSSELPDFFSANASRFLGLQHGAKNLARLQKFYTDHHRNPAALNPFIV